MRKIVLSLFVVALSVSIAQENPAPPTAPPPPRPNPAVNPPPAPGKRALDNPRIRQRLLNRIENHAEDMMLRNLSPENRARVEDARTKAQEDPKVKELKEKAEVANREYFEAMRAKLAEIDPGVEKIMRENAEKMRGGGGKGRTPGERPVPPAPGIQPPSQPGSPAPARPAFQPPPQPGSPASGRPTFQPGVPPQGAQRPPAPHLTEEERGKLDVARKAVETSPAVQQARKAVEAAQTPEDKMQAHQALRKAMQEAMLAADPSVKDILAKMQPPQQPRPAPPGGQ